MPSKVKEQEIQSTQPSSEEKKPGFFSRLKTRIVSGWKNSTLEHRILGIGGILLSGALTGLAIAGTGGVALLVVGAVAGAVSLVSNIKRCYDTIKDGKWSEMKRGEKAATVFKLVFGVICSLATVAVPALSFKLAAGALAINATTAVKELAAVGDVGTTVGLGIAKIATVGLKGLDSVEKFELFTNVAVSLAGATNAANSLAASLAVPLIPTSAKQTVAAVTKIHPVVQKAAFFKGDKSEEEGEGDNTGRGIS